MVSIAGDDGSARSLDPRRPPGPPLISPALRRLQSDMEDYGFEYSDEEVEEQDVDIENQYYNSKGEQRGALFR